MELTVVGIGDPISLTLGSLRLNYKTNKQNEKLKKNLHNRDVKNQTRRIIINIYNSFLDALNVSELANHNVATIFIALQYIQSWSTAVFNINTFIVRSFNQANIILDDSEMIACLEKFTKSFADLSKVVSQYVNTSMPSSAIQVAWNKINQQNSRKYTQLLGIYDYNLLSQNPLDLEELKKMCAWIEDRNILDVLHNSFETHDCKFRLVLWNPATNINIETVELYNKNILTCIRQLHYSTKNKNSLDIVLFVNVLPLVTMKLKNQFTGQNFQDAIHRYKNNHDPHEKIFQFGKRTSRHFAVDLTEIAMTTKLDSRRTFFITFNQG